MKQLSRTLPLLLSCVCTLSAQTLYQKPPQPVLDVLGAPGSPQAVVSPDRTHLLITRSRRYPPIAEVSQPMLRLAGLRINPRTNGLHLSPVVTEITLKRIDGGVDIPLRTPAAARLSSPIWSPNGKHFAFTNTLADRIELWIGETATGTLRAIPNLRLNTTLGRAIEWMPDSRRLLVRTVPTNRAPNPPTAPEAPTGPKIQESSGKYAPVRTLQDLLTSTTDMDIFDYYVTSQVQMVDAATGRATAFPTPGIYSTIDASPDGRYILYARIKRPYSLLHQQSSFPRDYGVWDPQGNPAHKLFSKPLADSVPIDGVATGPRQIAWRPDEPATLFWVEALDDGDPAKKVSHRDKLMTWKAPFSAQPAEWMRTEHRFDSIDWGQGFAFVRDYERDRRWIRTLFLNTNDTGVPSKTVFSRSSQDRYRDPGSPVEITTPTGHRMMLQDGDFIYLAGTGATPQGARPFLDRYNAKTGESTRLFRSNEKGYERVVAVLDAKANSILTEFESPTEPPNWALRTTGSENRKPITNYTDPTPQLRSITKQLVRYKRADGVDLSFTLYLPPGHKAGTRLPTVVWAYPREFADPGVAGQFGGSTQRFTTLSGTSHLFFLLAGYAVLDDASMPVVGSPETVNNTYVEQIVSSAKAAIDKAVEMGVTDRDRVGVGGHSYGAFMTANLLAHSDLFRAGVARSGAYNRTLTPFGFQAERRTLWQAENIYLRMSPFMVAHKINEPILLIHGEADNNAGTFPIQSDRMYQAVRGNGGIVKLVFLPHESHGYVGRESVEHTLAEMIGWFDKHVKNATDR
jgi:dipeptidyl aminopeptidase/acylaminoacyl peptidase